MKMAAVDCTPNYGKSHNRKLNKSSEYRRPSNLSSQNPQSRRKTAAERLEADKLKYVKSSKARQRRFTLELHSTSPHNDSTGTHSMGTASTGSPINMDDEDTSDYVGCDVANHYSKDSIHRSQSNGTFYSAIQPTHRTVVRSGTDSNFTTRLGNSMPMQTRETDVVVVQPVPMRKAPVPEAASSQKSCKEPTPSSNGKNTNRAKSLSNYLNKAKEGLKAVTSTISGGASPDDSTSGKSRQSRSSTAGKGSKYRSASVGASVYRNREAIARQTDRYPLDRTVSDSNPVMSPRSQLKHARNNLKKVSNNKPKYEKISTASNQPKTQDENSLEFMSPSARPKSNTFTVVPRTIADKKVTKPGSEQGKQSPTTDKPPPASKPAHLRGRPLSVIENGGAQSKYLQEKLSKPERFEAEHQRGVVRRRSSSSKEDDPNAYGNDVDFSNQVESRPPLASVRRVSSQRLKRRSWDLAHTMDTSLQLSLNKAAAPTSLTPDPDMVLTSPLTNLPRQRKSWSRQPASAENRKSNRISYHEGSLSIDVNYNKPGARKSITEALEEIFNPLEQDDEARLNATSPETTTESRTLVGQNHFCRTISEKANERSVADNINNLLRGSEALGDIEFGSTTRSKTPESSRSKTPTGEQAMDYFGANDVDIGIVTNKYPPSSYSKSKSSANSSPGSLNRRASGYQNEASKSTESAYSDSRLWTSYGDNQVISTQPLNRIDQAPAATGLQNPAGIPNSPMLAPRSRREVAPDCNLRSNTNSLSRSGAVNDETINTMRSQNTSSSMSNDAAKPFTALTANDLKPRKQKPGFVNPTMPMKPTFPYPMQPTNARSNSKRHTNAPVSPTMSPHKQQARMSSSHNSRSSSSTPYSSLKRTPTSSRSSSLKRNHRQRSKSDVSMVQNELDRFFSSMGMGEAMMSPYPNSPDTLFTTALVSSESDFSFAGASAYVRDGPDEVLHPMEVDPMTASLSQVPSVSIIEKNARIMRWLNTCRKSNSSSVAPGNSVVGAPPPPRIPIMSAPLKDSSSPGNGRIPSSPSQRRILRSYSVESPSLHPTQPPHPHKYPGSMPYLSSPPPIPPRVGLPKESDV